MIAGRGPPSRECTKPSVSHAMANVVGSPASGGDLQGLPGVAARQLVVLQAGVAIPEDGRGHPCPAWSPVRRNSARACPPRVIASAQSRFKLSR